MVMALAPIVPDSVAGGLFGGPCSATVAGGIAGGACGATAAGGAAGGLCGATVSGGVAGGVGGGVCWTNATKALGSVFDVTYAAYFFEAGNAPLSLVGQVNNVDYRSTNAPSPRTAAATNFLVWQGMTWNSLTDGNDNPVGYFRTNYSYNYTTNTTVTFAENSWQSILQANNSVGSASVTSGGWTKAAVDLSAYAGPNVQVAFHFQSGGSGWGNASGWYVDDVSLVANPMLTVPTNQAIYAGQTLTATNFATNSILPNSRSEER